MKKKKKVIKITITRTQQNIFLNSTFKPRSLAEHTVQETFKSKTLSDGFQTTQAVIEGVLSVFPLPRAALGHPASRFLSGGVCENLIPQPSAQLK